MHENLQEEYIPNLTSGVTDGVDNSDTQSDYSKRMMTLPLVEVPKPNITAFVDGNQYFQLQNTTYFNAGIDGSALQSDYSKRIMQLPPMEDPNPIR